MTDKIEFHFGDRIIGWAESSHAPDRGDKVNLRQQTYKVIGRTYTVDYVDNHQERSVVCVLNLEECPDHD